MNLRDLVHDFESIKQSTGVNSELEVSYHNALYKSMFYLLALLFYYLVSCDIVYV